MAKLKDAIDREKELEALLQIKEYDEYLRLLDDISVHEDDLLRREEAFTEFISLSPEDRGALFQEILEVKEELNISNEDVFNDVQMKDELEETICRDI